MNMEKHADKIFVYGTLRRGFALHPELKKLGARYLGKGRVTGTLFDLGEYPGLIRSGGNGSRVEGELYEIKSPSEQLPVLDKLEEFDAKRPGKSLFVRKRVTVTLKQGVRTRAWGYVLPRKPRHARVIASGIYADSRRVQSLPA